METGTKISLAGHGLLLTWAVFGAWFPSEPLPMQVQEVAVISADDFARLSQRAEAPELSPEPAAMPAPQEAPAEPDFETAPQPEPELSRPEPVAPPAPDPEPAARPEPEPEPEVADSSPGAPVPPSPAEPEQPDATALVTPPQARPRQRPADRVAPEPVAPPEPDVKIGDIEQPEVAPDEGAQEPQEVQEATAPEAASDRIVTEENEGEEIAFAAPERSVRPKGRPLRPDPAARPEPAAQPAPAEKPAETPEPVETAAKPAEPAEPDTSSAVEDALAEALSGGGETQAPEPSGPPLTSGEKDALRVEVSRCWNVGSLSTDALGTTVVVAVTLAQDGKPDTGSIRMLSSSGGPREAAGQAFEAARRAIIRCGAKGFNLPADKYAQWRDIEMTFNPERMRIK